MSRDHRPEHLDGVRHPALSGDQRAYRRSVPREDGGVVVFEQLLRGLGGSGHAGEVSEGGVYGGMRRVVEQGPAEVKGGVRQVAAGKVRTAAEEFAFGPRAARRTAPTAACVRRHCALPSRPRTERPASGEHTDQQRHAGGAGWRGGTRQSPAENRARGSPEAERRSC